MSDAGTEESTDYSKMKVNDLKKLLKSRGLSVIGNKPELVERLQTSEAAAGPLGPHHIRHHKEALLEGSEGGDPFDEDLERELDETPLEEDSPIKSESEPPRQETVRKAELKLEEEKKNSKTSESESRDKAAELKNGITETDKSIADDKHVKVNLKTVSLSDAARKKARAERFGAGTKVTTVLAQRAERFASTTTAGSTTTKQADSTTSIVTTSISKTTPVSSDVLKRRAERFGILSPVDIKRQHLEKLQARKLRFQQQPSTETATLTTELKANVVTTTDSDKKTQIAVPATASTDERKRLRAQRMNVQDPDHGEMDTPKIDNEEKLKL